VHGEGSNGRDRSGDLSTDVSHFLDVSCFVCFSTHVREVGVGGGGGGEKCRCAVAGSRQVG
jgi:hypothetical protein